MKLKQKYQLYSKLKPNIQNNTLLKNFRSLQNKLINLTGTMCLYISCVFIKLICVYMFKLCCNFCYNNVLRNISEKIIFRYPSLLYEFGQKIVTAIASLPIFTNKDILNRICYSNVLQNMPGNALFQYASFS